MSLNVSKIEYRNGNRNPNNLKEKLIKQNENNQQEKLITSNGVESGNNQQQQLMKQNKKLNTSNGVKSVKLNTSNRLQNRKLNTSNRVGSESLITSKVSQNKIKNNNSKEHIQKQITELPKKRSKNNITKNMKAIKKKYLSPLSFFWPKENKKKYEALKKELKNLK